MNPDLQNQTDQLLVWLKQIEAHSHTTAQGSYAVIALLFLILIVLLITRRQ